MKSEVEKRHKLLVIGNGFDLYLGLPTKYSDFALFCNQDNWKIFYENCKSENQNGKVVFDWNNQQNIIDFALAIDYEKVQNDIEYMNENIKNCFLFNFLLEYGDISAWNNFEGILDKLCKQIQRYCDEVEGLPNINQNIKYMEADMIAAIRLLRFTKGCFNPEPAMVGNSKRANDFLKDRISECKAEFITCLKSQIDLFNKLFMIYLKLIEMVPYINFNILENITNDDLVVSFNYTTTVNKINNNIYNIHYIHSNIIYKDIITGISNEEVTKDFAPLIKSFQRDYHNTRDDISSTINYYKWIDKLKKNNEKFVVYVFGHSLSNIDYDVLRDIFNNDNIIEYNIYFNKEESKNKLVDNFKEIMHINSLNGINIKFINVNNCPKLFVNY